MRRFLWLIVGVLLLASCQSTPVAVTVLDGERVYTLTSSQRLPGTWLEEAGVSLAPADRVLYLGQSTPLDRSLPEADAYTLQVRRAVTLVLSAPGQEPRPIYTSAPTVGEALAEAGLQLYVGDFLDPPAGTPLFENMSVSYRPGRELVIVIDGTEVRTRSSAETVAQALAGAGVPLVGLDYSIPAGNASLPADGRIQVIRVTESVSLTQTLTPYETRTELTADLELDQQEIIQIGEPGLAVSRTRVRYEQGAEVGRTIEQEAVVRPPRDQITGYGTQVVIRTAVVDGVTIEYWRSMQVYVTSYAPCGGYTMDVCYYYTSSRKPVDIGVVAMVRSWYYIMQGWPIYVPGYGRATIEDVGGGWPPGNHYWVDLGYTDDNYVPWSGWITIYYLTPVPASIPYVLP
ncbi:MAG: G5 domain-containing protein [Anaerolineales bacterium]|nr:G5 domain-containing protein [Anaerolineales bacterium]